MPSSQPAASSPLDPLEPRLLLAWGAYPQLIDQDQAAATYPQVNGSGQLIVVIDSGVNLNHPNLKGKLWTNPGEIAGDGIDNDHDGYVDDVHGYDFFRNDPNPDDEVGHGTAVAGIIAATPFTYNGAIYAGLAQGSRIISLKVLDLTSAYSPGTEQRIEKALQWVEMMNKRFRITAVNLSLYTPADVYHATYADEIQRLSKAGLIISASGGQDDPNADVHFPSADPLVYATSIVDQDDHLSTIVNRGPMLDLLAPGKNVPILSKTGSNISVSNEGSSFSTPYTTAAAAMMRQIDLKFTAGQVMGILKDSGVSVTDTSTQFTYSGLTYKRLDLDDAIKLAYARKGGIVQPPPPPPPPPPPAQSPYKGAAFSTGQIIQAEDFDLGGEGVAYHDTTSSNVGGGAYRTSAVDTGAIPAGSGGGYAVTYAVAGEWLEYTIDVTTAGPYVFNARVASPRPGAKFHVEIDGRSMTGSLAVPVTPSWQDYALMRSGAFNLTVGRHVLRVAFESNNSFGYAGNFDWFSITSAS